MLRGSVSGISAASGRIASTSGSKGAVTVVLASATSAPTILVVGTDYTLAPVATRERLALEGQSAASLLHALRSTETVLEAAVLCTCNRTELYVAAADAEAGIARVRQAFIDMLGEHAAATDELLFTRQGPDAVRHLCAVAAGLESMVMAETQILGQVRSAIDHARELNASGAYLSTAFRIAISCGKRVRTDTALGRVDTSVGSVLIDLMCERGIDWSQQRVLLIGAGRMNAAAAGRLRALGVRDLVVASRTLEAATSLASAMGGQSVPMADIGPVARTATFIVSATRSPALTLTADMLEGRPLQPLIVADLAVPRDVDPVIGALPGVTLVDIDGLRMAREPGSLSDALAAASAIIEESTREWQVWYRTRTAVPLITELRAHVDFQRDIELARTMAHLDHLAQRDREAVAELANRLVNKMFHHLALRLKRAAADPELGQQYLEMMRFLVTREDSSRPSDGLAREDSSRASDHVAREDSSRASGQAAPEDSAGRAR